MTAAKPISYKDLALLTPRKAPFTDPDWVFELKHDGFRVLAIRDGTRTSLISRRGNELIAAFPEIAIDLLKLPDIVLDGELVILDDQGKPRFDLLRARSAMRRPDSILQAARANPAAMFAFDILMLKGKDLRKLPLLKRKAILQRELKKTDRIIYMEHVAENGERLFDAAEQLGLEGIVAKRADSTYQRGRTPNWVKIKTKAGLAIDEERKKWNE